jgi:hypothetical protein
MRQRANGTPDGVAALKPFIRDGGSGAGERQTMKAGTVA